MSEPPWTVSEFAGKRVAAGLCGILVGALGIHKLIVGQYGGAGVLLLLTFGSCLLGAPFTWLIGFAEGVRYLTMSDEAFHEAYAVHRRGWF
ncbi:MAG: hypothetical protein AAGA48_08905 [Myxococcota bacterium]